MSGTRWAGASVRGTRHNRFGVACQDHWEGWCNKSGTGVVVADGLGSRPRARESALAACKAVKAAIRQAPHPQNLDPPDLTAAIEAIWTLTLSAYESDDIGATCLFSWAPTGGPVLLGQLGDGMVCYRHGGRVSRLRTMHSRWLNLTATLGAGHDWSIGRFDQLDTVVLATDGVAEDLIPDHEVELFALIDQDVAGVGRRDASARIRKGLLNWPGPGATDDLTLAVHWP